MFQHASSPRRRNVMLSGGGNHNPGLGHTCHARHVHSSRDCAVGSRIYRTRKFDAIAQTTYGGVIPCMNCKIRTRRCSLLQLCSSSCSSSRLKRYQTRFRPDEQSKVSLAAAANAQSQGKGTNSKEG
nr:hypothetical protein CFP56_44456 [Quercus suber]